MCFSYSEFLPQSNHKRLGHLVCHPECNEESLRETCPERSAAKSRNALRSLSLR